MPRIERSIEIHASREAVWKVISDLDSEPDYWYGTKEVRIITKSDLNVQREITQNFRNHKILQQVVLHPPDFMEISYLKGLTEGTKMMTIREISSEVQILNVAWNVHFTGIYRLATPFIKRHTALGTEHALERIKSAAEAKSKQVPI